MYFLSDLQNKLLMRKKFDNYWAHSIGREGDW